MHKKVQQQPIEMAVTSGFATIFRDAINRVVKMLIFGQATWISVWPGVMGSPGNIIRDRAVVAHQPHKLEVVGSSPAPVPRELW